MKIIDLTHSIANNMTVYPGGPQPQNKIISTVTENGYKETEIHIHSHNGTHMDSPNHVFEDGVSLDKIDVLNFVGTAALVDCSSLGEGDIITYDFIEKNKESIDNSEFIIFRTDWSKYWNTQKYLGNYPVISDEVVDFIMTSNKKGIAFDTISVDPIDASILAKHHKVLKNNILIFENLTNLDLIKSNTFVFCALPLKFENSDGAPIRAIAMLD
ncbi:Kynurenine formamidase [Terrisporobacter petrolearius]|uniref:cyclase family protein n=1 Tax=Terrisporobacter petrolearius TaxID=1460447 RepID=UPI0033694BCA